MARRMLLVSAVIWAIGVLHKTVIISFAGRRETWMERQPRRGHRSQFQSTRLTPPPQLPPNADASIGSAFPLIQFDHPASQISYTSEPGAIVWQGECTLSTIASYWFQWVSRSSACWAELFGKAVIKVQEDACRVRYPGICFSNYGTEHQ